MAGSMAGQQIMKQIKEKKVQPQIHAFKVINKFVVWAITILIVNSFLLYSSIVKLLFLIFFKKI